MKQITILGSTGSIGKSALCVVRNHRHKLKVVALSSNSNIYLLSRQAAEFRPRCVCIIQEDLVKELKSSVPSGVKVFSGAEGLLEMLEYCRVDMALLAISGSAALMPLFKLIETGTDVALANKEALVMAGPIIMKEAFRKNVKIIPVDSEQSAIWQCWEKSDKSRIKKIHLTASGGPFREKNKKDFSRICVNDALRHPRWNMGRKITIDSATLMNKGLEVFEAMYLFGVQVDLINVVIHPEAIIHSMVEYIDGVILAQMSAADMRIPIQYALTYPLRLESGVSRIDLFKLAKLHFIKPDFSKFPCLKLALRVASDGGTMPAVLNASNEISVNNFLENKISFTAIPEVVRKVLGRHKNITNPGLASILDADNWARQETYRQIEKMR